MTGAGKWPSNPAAKRGPAAQIAAIGGQPVYDDIAARYNLEYLAKVITGCLGAGTEVSAKAAAARIVFHVEYRIRAVDGELPLALMSSENVTPADAT